MNKEKMYTAGLGILVSICSVMLSINFFYPLLGITIRGSTPLIFGGIGFLLTLAYFIFLRKDNRLFLLMSLSGLSLLSIWTTFSIWFKSPVWENEEGAIIIFCTAPCAIIYIIGAILFFTGYKHKSTNTSYQSENNQ